MSDFTFLRDLVVVFSVGVAVVAALRRIGAPSISGFIVAGILLGPRSLGLVSDPHQVELLAEVGIVLLLFGIGIEMSQKRLARLWKPILTGGSLQVGFTVLITLAITRVFGLPARQGMFLGFLAAVSSTAIVLRGLDLRGELDAPHGRLALGILVFQDLCVVPMVLAIPLLAAAHTSGVSHWGALLEALVVLAGVLLAARVIVPRGLHLVARGHQRDLFLLSVLLICLGTAWIVSLAGISLALGAFLAGLVISGSEYRHQALADLVPFREVFTIFFFVSMGMLFDPGVMIRNPAQVFGLFGAIVVGKFLIVFFVAAVMKLSLRVCALTGVALSQVGEFSFVLVREASGTGLFHGTLASSFFDATILSMLITPVALAVGPHVAAGLGKSRTLTRMLQVPVCADCQESFETLADHVIIAGYGITGQNLARSLQARNVPYVIADLNPENVRQAAAMGEPAFYGDVTSLDVLKHLGVADAKEVVLVINDPDAAARAVRAVRKIAPRVHVLVRSRYVDDLDDLVTAGSTEVIAAELEAADEVTRRVLSRHASPA
jgi:CPA2 family monovalent cation:H+ antiporter-2